jgi:hypothetical protein
MTLRTFCVSALVASSVAFLAALALAARPPVH